MIQIKIPTLVTRLIMEMYEKQSMAVWWNNEYSDSFRVSNGGVKQGDVLSLKFHQRCIVGHVSLLTNS